MTSTIHRQWEDEMPRERISHPPDMRRTIKWSLLHCLLVTRILVVKWVCQGANMTNLLVMELTAAMGI